MAKTEKLLEGLKGEGIRLSVRNLAGYMAGVGVRVSPHVGRMRGNITMPSFGFDVQKMSETGNAFYKDRVSNGRLNFIPSKKERELSRLESRLRAACEKRTLADDFMPVEAYKSLREEFEDLRRQYFLLRDDILLNWPQIESEFEQGAREMLIGVDLPDDMREKILKEFLAELPTKERYKNSFSMDLRVHAFHADLLIPGLDSTIADDVRKTWANEVVSTAVIAIERQVGEGWSRIMSIMKRYLKNGNIPATSITSLEKYGEELKWKNVFHNELLTELSESMARLDGAPDSHKKADILEGALITIWEYAKDSGIVLECDDIPYTVQQLDELLETEQKLRALA